MHPRHFSLRPASPWTNSDQGNGLGRVADCIRLFLVNRKIEVTTLFWSTISHTPSSSAEGYTIASDRVLREISPAASDVSKHSRLLSLSSFLRSVVWQPVPVQHQLTYLWRFFFFSFTYSCKGRDWDLSPSNFSPWRAQFKAKRTGSEDTGVLLVA